MTARSHHPGGEMFRTPRFVPLLPVGLVVLAACQDTATEPDPETREPQEALVVSRETLERPHEAIFHELSSQLKSYGGHYLDEEGNLVAYLTDGAEQDRALALLEPVLAKHQFNARQRRGKVVFQKAAFTFLDLAAYRDRASEPVLELKQVEFTDLDEARNRVVIGVSGAEAKEAALRVLAENKVPLEAVEFEETTPVRDLVTLRDYRRPLEGGLQIGSSVGTCTLGFNAYWSGVRGFLTNSHCTSNFWANDGTSFYQNASPYYVGYEIRDPAAHSCGFLGIFSCRWSDAALVRTTASVTSNYGYIARTTFWATGDGNSGSLTINNSNPRMRITGEYSFPVGGEMFDKMGRTSGWTYGYVAKTCVDVNKSGLRRVRCQDYIKSMHAIPGDSGSPIFRWHGNTVTLAGILWGGINEGGTQYTIMSAMWNIERDIGALSTF
jgi:hypothetical protein